MSFALPLATSASAATPSFGRSGARCNRTVAVATRVYLTTRFAASMIVGGLWPIGR